MTTDTTSEDVPFAAGEWCLIEQMGHRKMAAFVREVTIAGEGFLRLDIPAVEGDPGRTLYIRPGTLYALHPVSEATAKRVAAHWRPEPVGRWELPALADKPADEDDPSRHVDADYFNDHPGGF